MKDKGFLVIIIIFTILAAIFLFSILREDYICDIGKNETAGDFEVSPDTFFNNRQCAVEDCVAFNEYQEKTGGEELCLV